MRCGANGADTGIDVSATSGAVLLRTSKKMQLNNLQVYQLPIELRERVGTTFDQMYVPEFSITWD